MAITQTADPVVMTDGNGRARLSHGHIGEPSAIRLSPSDVNLFPLSVVVEEVGAEEVGFRVFSHNGQPLRHHAVAVRVEVY